MGEKGVAQSPLYPLLGLTHTDCFDFHPNYKKRFFYDAHTFVLFDAFPSSLLLV